MQATEYHQTGNIVTSISINDTGDIVITQDGHGIIILTVDEFLRMNPTLCDWCRTHLREQREQEADLQKKQNPELI